MLVFRKILRTYLMDDPLTRLMLEAKFGDDHPWRHYHLVTNLSKVNNKDAGMTEIQSHSSVFIVNFKQTLLDIKFE